MVRGWDADEHPILYRTVITTKDGPVPKGQKCEGLGTMQILPRTRMNKCLSLRCKDFESEVGTISKYTGRIATAWEDQDVLSLCQEPLVGEEFDLGLHDGHQEKGYG